VWCAGVRRVHNTRWKPHEVSAQYQSSPPPSSPGGPSNPYVPSGASLPRPSSTTGSAPLRTAPQTFTRSPSTGSGLRDWGGEGAILSSEGPDELYHQLVEVGTRWSDRHAQAEYLEEGTSLPPPLALASLPQKDEIVSVHPHHQTGACTVVREQSRPCTCSASTHQPSAGIHSSGLTKAPCICGGDICGSA